MSVDWSYYDNTETDRINSQFLPTRGEGDSKGTQIVTAINKLIYKWYNDGDVYDNTGLLDGWANDLSSYANWLYKYVPKLRSILDGIFECSNDSDYENLLQKLHDAVMDLEDIENFAKQPKVGSIYECSGPFTFKDYSDDDEDSDDEYSDEYYRSGPSDFDDEDYEEDDDIESSVDITAAEDDDAAPTKDEQFDELLSSIKDDYDLLLSGIDKLRRNGASTFSEGYNIAKQLSDNLNELISAVGERF